VDLVAVTGGTFPLALKAECRVFIPADVLPGEAGKRLGCVPIVADDPYRRPSVEGVLIIEDLGVPAEAKEVDEIDNLLEPDSEGLPAFWWW
jgi:hypothetical protein